MLSGLLLSISSILAILLLFTLVLAFPQPKSGYIDLNGLPQIPFKSRCLIYLIALVSPLKLLPPINAILAKMYKIFVARNPDPSNLDIQMVVDNLTLPESSHEISDSPESQMIMAFHPIVSMTSVMLFAHNQLMASMLGAVHKSSLIEVQNPQGLSEIFAQNTSTKPVFRLVVAVAQIFIHRAGLEVEISAQVYAKHTSHTQKSPSQSDQPPIWLARNSFVFFGATPQMQIFSAIQPPREQPEFDIPLVPEIQPHPSNTIIRSEIHLDKNLGRDYARISGDLNPIHISHIGARIFGFKGMIAHGMRACEMALPYILVSQRTSNWAAKMPDKISFGAQFRKPLTLPAKPIVVSEQIKQSSHYYYWIINDQNTVHTRGFLIASV